VKRNRRVNRRKNRIIGIRKEEYDKRNGGKERIY
jgi:hypothetical protein